MRDFGAIFVKQVGGGERAVLHFPWTEWGYAGHWAQGASGEEGDDAALNNCQDAAVAVAIAGKLGLKVLQGGPVLRHSPLAREARADGGSASAAGVSSEGGDREYNGNGVLMMSEGARPSHCRSPCAHAARLLTALPCAAQSSR